MSYHILFFCLSIAWCIFHCGIFFIRLNLLLLIMFQYYYDFHFHEYIKQILIEIKNNMFLSVENKINV